ncbi:hypothetical protein ICN41_08925 [Polynucleobacter sp. 15G-AUS-farblos]|uniref:DUF7024 domain-containing protein n=1 Tax=Polynucleobacter sp. 15G-AUS-farblos TaxID=2689094 RepID=UPI001C0D1FC6|nr:hypothetical protein [Polynucleobacter sp. 15G-AUS-farblos]MBU3584106.1 hypothetical protein [Polynucleobacter sp. 15G-AUS-farblos]
MSMRSIVRSTLTALCICLASYSLIAAYAHFWLTEPKIKLGQVISFNNPNDKLTNEMLFLGWATPEPWGVWSNGEKAILILPNPSPNASKLIIHARAFVNPKHAEQNIDISINQQPLPSARLVKDSDNTITITLDKNLQSSKVYEIDFRFHNATSPLASNLGSDTRNLGIGIEWLQFQ